MEDTTTKKTTNRIKSGILTRERINTNNLNTILSSELLLQCTMQSFAFVQWYSSFFLAYHGSAIDYTTQQLPSKVQFCYYYKSITAMFSNDFSDEKETVVV